MVTQIIRASDEILVAAPNWMEVVEWERVDDWEDVEEAGGGVDWEVVEEEGVGVDWEVVEEEVVGAASDESVVDPDVEDVVVVENGIPEDEVVVVV